MSQSETTESIKAVSDERLPNPLHLPWHLTRLLDRQALRQKLNVKGLIGLARRRELEGFLVCRASDARDLFALRGVRTRRSTVFQLMSRSIAADAAAANENRAPIGGLETPRAEASLVPASLVAALR